jgi:predicted ATPase
MPEFASGFQSLPPEYQHVIQLAQDEHNITITPLQELVGGWSGAVIYLVSVAYSDSGRVEHLVLKLDRTGKKSSSDEIARHLLVLGKSPPDFARRHIPEIAFGRVESEHAHAIFYAIAGQSLHNYRPLSKYRRQSQLETIFAATCRYLLAEWNVDLAFEQAVHPQALLKKWLGFRLDPGGNTERFLSEICRVHPDSAGFLIRGNIFPNPLRYARNQDPWSTIRPGDAIIGLQHGDLNTNNVLVEFSKNGEQLTGYYLIDFALFKAQMPLLYDQRYLEMSYLIHTMSQGSFSSTVDLITRLAEDDILEPHQVPIEMAGANAVIRAGRLAFDGWVRESHPSLHDDLWGQYWLAGVAAGLSYCHKAGQADEQRLAGLIYAAANLKRYAVLFGLPAPGEARQLYDESQFAGEPRSEVVVGSPAGQVPHNLPTPPTKFIGRASEVAAVTESLLLPDVRLVTLTGPGGSGKTRLGLEVARGLLDKFPQGVYFVDLAPINDPALVATTIAHSIGVREGGGRPPLDNLKDYLANKRMLLLFDNFEQVSHAAPIVAELLASAPGIKILVTSRISLQLRAEHEYPVSPLRTPSSADATHPLEQILQYEAVAFFRQQARAVDPDFDVTPENSAAVIEICRRLDGLPLAIEIAAARIKMLPPQALLRRLDRSLKLLVGGAKDLPARQQTLRETIDWSYQLLQPEEQTLFARVGIFAGGFSLESVEGVCNPDGDMDVFSGIESLLNNSLLRQVESASDGARFDMLQTIREYALEKLEESGALADFRQAHSAYYTRQAEGMGVHIYGGQSAQWLARLDEEYDNIRAALTWSLEDKDRLDQAVTICASLLWFWYRRGHFHEGRKWSERALEAADHLGAHPLRAQILTVAAIMAMWETDLHIAAQRAEEAQRIVELLGAEASFYLPKLACGIILINQGRDKEAYHHLIEVVEHFDESGLSWWKATALVHLANVSLGLGDFEQATKWLDMAMPIIKKEGDPWQMAFGLNNYGEVARAQQDYEKAEEYYRATRAFYQEADAKGDEARLELIFGYLAQHKGDYEEARALFNESLTHFRELGNKRGMAECLAGLAGLAAEQGKHAWAAPLLSAAETQLTSFGGAWWPADRVEFERTLERLQSALKEEFKPRWTEGQAMGIEPAIAYAATF